MMIIILIHNDDATSSRERRGTQPSLCARAKNATRCRELFFVTTIEKNVFGATANPESLCSSVLLKTIIKLHHITLPQVEDKKKRRRPRRSQSERRVRNRTLTERDVKHLERHLSMKRTIRWNKEVLTSSYGKAKTEKTDLISSIFFGQHQSIKWW